MSRKFFTKESRTKQSERHYADINNVYNRYVRLPAPDQVYSIDSNIVYVPNFDFQQAQNRLIAVKNHFASLTSVQRAAFDNDAMKFAKIFSDVKNHQKLVDAGIFSVKYFPHLEARASKVPSAPLSKPEPVGAAASADKTTSA